MADSPAAPAAGGGHRLREQRAERGPQPVAAEERPGGRPHGGCEGAPAAFVSILWGEREVAETGEAPDFFTDLALDQITEAVAARCEEHDLRPFFYTSSADRELILYRQQVMRDLEDERTRDAVRRFCAGMREVRRGVTSAEGSHYPHQRQAWMVDNLRVYCASTRQLARELAAAPLRSAGLTAFRDWLRRLVDSAAFRDMAAQADALVRRLDEVRYTLLIRGPRVTVRLPDPDDHDYSLDIARTFARFRQGEVRGRTFRLRSEGSIDHVQAQIVQGVARLYPDLFAELTAFCRRHADPIDPVLRRFDREVSFYLAWFDFIAPLRARGLGFCYPVIVADKRIRCRDGFDLALAHSLSAEGRAIVCNDFHLDGAERIFVVTGPNQGGKTTFARMFGQLHYLARLGLPVPAREARLFLFDNLFTHFDREEELATLRGKLYDDLVRIRAILERATPRSLIIMNEIFSSTALEDALFLAREVLGRIMRLDALGVCVTFLDELATLGPQTVSVVSTVVPENPAERTFRIVRRPADGLAYALSIAEKYGVTYRRLKERLGR